MYKYLALIILWAPCFLLEESIVVEETTMMPDVRKIYGMNYQNCHDYFITFKCMTACKSNGFYIFRLDSRCRCTCHDVSTPTVLPYFKWRTKGTTRRIPKTQSVSLYHVVGTLSPKPTKPTTTTTTTTELTCPPVSRADPDGSGSGSGDGDDDDDGSGSGSGSGDGDGDGDGSGDDDGDGSGDGDGNGDGSGSGDGSGDGEVAASPGDKTNPESVTNADEEESKTTPSA